MQGFDLLGATRTHKLSTPVESGPNIRIVPNVQIRGFFSTLVTS